MTDAQKVRLAILQRASADGAELFGTDLTATLKITSWNNVNLDVLVATILSALAARGDSGAEARAEPLLDWRDPLNEVVVPAAFDALVARVAELEWWRSTFKSEMVERATVTCRACGGSGRPTPEAFAYHKSNFCEGCGGSGVHRV